MTPFIVCFIVVWHNIWISFLLRYDISSGVPSIMPNTTKIHFYRARHNTVIVLKSSYAVEGHNLDTQIIQKGKIKNICVLCHRATIWYALWPSIKISCILHLFIYIIVNLYSIHFIHII